MKTVVLLICLVSAPLISGSRVSHPGLKTYLSSVYNHAGTLLTADRALDRNNDIKNPTGILDTLAHTNNEATPWWVVDLQKPYKPTSLLISIRGGSEYRLADFIVGVSNVHPLQVAPVPGQYEVCFKFSGTPAPGKTNVQCNPNIQPSRFVIIQLPGTQYLELQDVEIYVADYNILTPSLFTYQSSTLVNNGIPLQPFYAINQDYSNYFIDATKDTCTHTKSEPNSWWAVELDGLYVLTSVKLVLRQGFTDRASGIQIGVTNDFPLTVAPSSLNLAPCGKLEGAPTAGIVTITCTPTIAARYVVAYLPQTNFLELCEVEMFGNHA